MSNKKFALFAFFALTLPCAVMAQQAPDQNFCAGDFSVNEPLHTYANSLCAAGQTMLATLAAYKTNSDPASGAENPNANSMASILAKYSSPASAPSPAPAAAVAPAKPAMPTAPATPVAPAKPNTNPYAYS